MAKVTKKYTMHHLKTSNYSPDYLRYELFFYTEKLGQHKWHNLMIIFPAPHCF